MAAPYDLTGLTNSTRVEQLFITANTASNNILAGGFMIALFMVITGSFMLKYGFKKAILAGSASSTLLSMFLVQAGMINSIFLYFFLGATAFSTLYAYLVQ